MFEPPEKCENKITGKHACTLFVSPDRYLIISCIEYNQQDDINDNRDDALHAHPLLWGMYHLTR